MPAPPSALLTAASDGGPGCERLADGLLAEPVSAVSSLAFVVAALVIAARDTAPSAPVRRAVDARDHARSRLTYATLVGGIGVGSVVQHGPDPAWSDIAHDLPLLATLAYVGADAVADLSRRRRAAWWWAAPTAALVPLILLAPRAGDLAQVGVAAVAVTLTVARAMRRPQARRPIAWALASLAVGATLGTLSRSGGPLCDPDSLWQGHAAWHVLASVGLVALAPVVARPVSRPVRTVTPRSGRAREDGRTSRR